MNDKAPGFKITSYTAGRREQPTLLNQKAIDQLSRLDEAFAQEVGIEKKSFEKVRRRAKEVYEAHTEAEGAVNIAAAYSTYALESKDIANGVSTDVLEHSVHVMQETYKAIKEENNELSLSFQQCMMENQKLEKENRQFKEENRAFIKERNDPAKLRMELRNAKLTQENGGLKASLAQVRKEKSGLTASLAEVQGKEFQLQQDVEEKDSRLQQLEQEAGQKDSRLQQKDSHIQQKDSRIQQLEHEARQKDSRLQQKEHEAGQKDSRIQQLEYEAGQKDSRIQELKGVQSDNSKLLDRLEAVKKVQDTCVDSDEQARNIQAKLNATSQAARLLGSSLCDEPISDDSPREKLKSVSLWNPKNALLSLIDKDMDALRQSVTSANQQSNNNMSSLRTASDNCRAREKELEMISTVISANPSFSGHEDMVKKVRRSVTAVKEAAEQAKGVLDDNEVPRAKLTSVNLFNPAAALRTAYENVSQGFETTSTMRRANTFWEDEDVQVNGLLPEIESAAEQAGGVFEDNEEPRAKLTKVNLFNPVETLRGAYDTISQEFATSTTLIKTNLILEDAHEQLNSIMPKIQITAELAEDGFKEEEPRLKLTKVSLFNPVEALRKTYDNTNQSFETSANLLKTSLVLDDQDAQVLELQTALQAVQADEDGIDADESEQPREKLTTVSLRNPLKSMADTLRETSRQIMSANSEKRMAEQETTQVRQQVNSAQAETSRVRKQLETAQAETSRVREQLETAQDRSKDLSEASRAFQSQLEIMANLVRCNAPAYETQEIDSLIPEAQRAADAVKTAAELELKERDKITGFQNVKPSEYITSDWKAVIQHADSQISGFYSMTSAVTTYADCFSGDDASQIQAVLEKVTTITSDVDDILADKCDDREKLRSNKPRNTIRLATMIDKLHQASHIDNRLLGTFATMTQDLVYRDDQEASRLEELTKGLDKMATLDACSDDEDDRPKIVFNPPKNTISLADKISGLRETSTTDNTILSNVSSLTLGRLPRPDVEEGAIKDVISALDVCCSMVLDSFDDSAPGNTMALTSKANGVRKEYMKDVLKGVQELLIEGDEALNQLVEGVTKLSAENSRMTRKINRQRQLLREARHGTD